MASTSLHAQPAVDHTGDALGSTPGGSTEAPQDRRSPIERRFATELGLAIDRLGFLPHRPNFFMPASYGRGFFSEADSARNAEILFQVSLKLPFTLSQYRADRGGPVLFFAYTGNAWWQAYDSRRSSPFREYNHAPEVFVQIPTDYGLFGWSGRSIQTGFEHSSNGRANGSSRSWNRLFVQADLDRSRHWWATLRAWWRIPEDAKPAPDVAEGDDNPDITRYYGHGALRLGYSTDDSVSWAVMLRQSFRAGGKGAVQFDLSYPTGFNPRTRWFVRLFHGYGESLIDYDRRVQRIGIGLMLNTWY